MLIKDWMATTILTVDANTSVMRATRTMKENNIRRLPVLSHGKLAGIITDRDLKDASPSSKTDMDLHEMYYLLSEMKVKDVMTSNPLTLSGEQSLEMAAVVMLDSRISGIPVVDDSGHLIGLLSETDVLRGFIGITGIKDGAVQFVLNVPDQPGSVTKVIELMRQHDGRVISILTSYEAAREGMKRVAIRITAANKEKIDAIAEQLKEHFEVIYQARDELKNLPKKQR